MTKSEAESLANVRNMFKELRNEPEAIAEGIAFDLTLAAETQRHALGIPYAEVARRMGVSRQHVSKLFSGTQNVTIGSIVKMAMALDCEVEISLKPRPKGKAKPTKPKKD